MLPRIKSNSQREKHKGDQGRFAQVSVCSEDANLCGICFCEDHINFLGAKGNKVALGKSQFARLVLFEADILE